MPPISIEWIDKWIKGWTDEMRDGAKMYILYFEKK